MELDKSLKINDKFAVSVLMSTLTEILMRYVEWNLGFQRL